MKYPEVVMAADMPSSLQTWLGQELDSLGIDASVYSRYVLSILQQDADIDVEQLKKINNSVSSASNVVHGKVKAKAKKTDKRKSGELSVDEVRKMAAIDYLLSVTDEASRIETLVEELYLKLKEIQSEGAERCSPKKVLHEIQLQNSKDCMQPVEDPTQKYYAAFPALSDKCDEFKPKSHKTPEDKVWAKVASKSVGEDSSADSSGSPGPEVIDKGQECNNNVTNRRKNIKSPPKEEKEKKNMESKHKGKEGKTGKRYSLFYDRNKDHVYSSPDAGSKNKKRSPNSRTPPNSRSYNKGKNIDSIKGKALFKGMDNDDYPSKRSVFKSRRSFPEFQPPSFVVPKTILTPKKTPMKYCDNSSVTKYGRCRSEEKTSISMHKHYLHRCLSQSVHHEENEFDVSNHNLLEVELKCLMASVEDLVWYTKPLDDIIMPSPVPKQRLYERNASENDESISIVISDGDINTEEDKECLQNTESCSNSPMEEFESTTGEEFLEVSGLNAKYDTEIEPKQELVFKEDYFEEVSRESSCSNIQDALGFGFNYVPPNTPVHFQDQHTDVFGLSSLIELAEQMKNLSQDSDPEYDLLSKFISQEEEGSKGIDIEQEIATPDTINENLSISPGEVLFYSNSPIGDNFPDPDDFISLFQNFESGKNHKHDGIPTPLSTCSSENENSDKIKEGISNMETELDEPVKTEENNNDTCDATSDSVIKGTQVSSDEVKKDEEELDISIYAAHLGHKDVIKQLELDSTGDIDNITCIKNTHTVNELDQNDIEAAQYSKANCDIITKSHLIWWDISGKPSIWSCVGEVTNTVWGEDNMSLLWNRSENAFRGTGLASRPSPLREFFSPRFQCGQESRIWDINMQMLDYSSPFEQSSQFSPPSIFSSQVNLTLTADLHMTFIEGGLYGTEWDRLLESTNEHFPDINDVFESTSTDWFLKPTEFRQRSRSDELNPLSDVTQMSPVSSIPKVPSENSAFTGVPRPECYDSPVFTNGPIHHVHSEPIISPERTWLAKEYSEAHYRMIEVKHLYKSDTSILRQLGLATGTDAEETDQSDSIEYSPDRHFVPIKTPQSSIDHTSPAISDAVTVIPEDHITDKGSLEGSWSGSFKSASRSSSYQLYKDQEPTEEDEDDDSTVYFIPRFKVQKQYEKCAQTGDSPLLEVDEDHEKTLTERLLTDMINVLEFDDDGSGDGDKHLTMKDLNDSMQHDCSGNSDYESMGHDTSGDEYHSTGIASLWVDSNQVENTPTEGTKIANSVMYKSIWSMGLDSDIPSVPTDLGSISETQGDLLLDAYAAAIDNFEDYLYQDWSSEDQTLKNYEEYPNPTPPHYSKPLPSQWSQEEGSSGQEVDPEWLNEEAFVENDHDLMFLMDPQVPTKIIQPPELLHNMGLYSAELEEQWFSDPSMFQVQVPLHKSKNKLGKKKFIPHSGGNRKPCSFFLEGSCRRNDCKFAHDMSSITCKFWEDGECFKGVTCPFLHGYPKVYGRPAITRKPPKERKEEFKLEKDDFPELSKSQEESSELSTSSGSDKRKKLTTLHGKEEKPVSFKNPEKRKKDKSSKFKARSIPIDIKFKKS